MVRCEYCGETEATVVMPNPNDFEEEQQPMWDVCATCKEVIALQQKLSFGEIIKATAHGDETCVELGQKVVDEAQAGLDAIAEREHIPIFSAKIQKGEKGYEVTETLTLGKPEKE